MFRGFLDVETSRASNTYICVRFCFMVVANKSQSAWTIVAMLQASPIVLVRTIARTHVSEVLRGGGHPLALIARRAYEGQELRHRERMPRLSCFRLRRKIRWANIRQKQSVEVRSGH